MPKRDDHSRRIHPRLRTLQNGAREVNALRSIASSTVATALSSTDLKGLAPLTEAFLDYTMEIAADATGKPPHQKLRKAAKLSSRRKASSSYVNVLIEILRDRMPNSRDRQQSTLKRILRLVEKGQSKIAGGDQRYLGSHLLVRRNFVSATIPVSALDELEQLPGVGFIHRSEPLSFTRPKLQLALNNEPPKKGLQDPLLYDHHSDGRNVIIGIIDVGGFDFAHPDFRDTSGGTRFSSIWDQGGNFRSPPGARGGKRLDYGSELTKPLMDAAIRAEQNGGLPAVMLEQQSQMSEGSHATHVASIAAGIHGVCPAAEIIGVLISIPDEGTILEERRKTFSDSTRIIHAVEYLLDLAERKNKPISINISLGTNGGAHDGSSGVNRWLDALLSVPGRAISLAAGNAGQDSAENDDDMGYIMGRIHANGKVASRGLSVDLEWNVVGGRIEDISENEMEIWYGAQDRITLMLKPPGSTQWLVVRPGEYMENRLLPNGTRVSIYNELYHPTNGANYTAIYLSPNYQRGSLRGVAGGVWRARLVGEEIRDGSFHCWIERDDPLEIEPGNATRRFFFPSFFTAASNVDSHSISSLACGFRVIAVANLDEPRQMMNVSSSQGPTRDGRSKPDIAAAGTDIIAAKGFSQDENLWVGMTGTSMASPYVAGVVGLMLCANAELTSAQCLGILQRTAQPLPGSSYDWRNDAGFGQINAAAAINEAVTFNRRTEV
jgi:subtilisin family serine protease